MSAKTMGNGKGESAEEIPVGWCPRYVGPLPLGQCPQYGGQSLPFWMDGAHCVSTEMPPNAKEPRESCYSHGVVPLPQWDGSQLKPRWKQKQR